MHWVNCLFLLLVSIIDLEEDCNKYSKLQKARESDDWSLFCVPRPVCGGRPERPGTSATEFMTYMYM